MRSTDNSRFCNISTWVMIVTLCGLGRAATAETVVILPPTRIGDAIDLVQTSKLASAPSKVNRRPKAARLLPSILKFWRPVTTKP